MLSTGGPHQCWRGLTGGGAGCALPRKKFYVTAFFNLAGLLFTILFVPDIMRLDLREGDRRWHYIKQVSHAYHSWLSRRLILVLECSQGVMFLALQQ